MVIGAWPQGCEPERLTAPLNTQLRYTLSDEGQAQLLGAVRQELLSGLREGTESRRLRDYLRDFPDATIQTEDYEEAVRAGNQCRRVGVSASPVDILICAVAMRHRWEIFTADPDFLRYQTVLKIHLFSRQ